jgi:predicted transcriptional regulator
MTSPLQTVTLDTSLYKVVQMMNQNNFRQVPVVDQNKVVGMATASIINTSIINDILEDIKLIALIFK